MRIAARSLRAPETEPPSWHWVPPTATTQPDGQLPLPIDDDLPAQPLPTPVSDANLQPVASWFAKLVMEAVHGHRSLIQLAARFEPRAMLTLVSRMASLKAVKASVASVHVQSPRSGVAEVTARLATTGTHIALAMRLEQVDNQWRCVVLVIG